MEHRGRFLLYFGIRDRMKRLLSLPLFCDIISSFHKKYDSTNSTLEFAEPTPYEGGYYPSIPKKQNVRTGFQEYR